jgi:hypothetical protein
MTTSTATRPIQSAVERAGVCADGDNCPRYHCRVCNVYWLGEPLHTCRPEARAIAQSRRVPEPVSVLNLDERIYAWMEQALAEGGDAARCTRNVLERVKAEGLGEALLDAYGDRLIGELWRDRGGHVDHNHKDEKVSAKNTPASGRRRVDVAQLATPAALIESLYQLDGNWYRLGDLNRLQCVALQHKYEAEADAVRARAIAFSHLVDGLADGQTVRQRWTAEQIEGLVGDTLRGGAASGTPT